MLLIVACQTPVLPECTMVWLQLLVMLLGIQCKQLSLGFHAVSCRLSSYAT